jgi:hypothetical protein
MILIQEALGYGEIEVWYSIFQAHGRDGRGESPWQPKSIVLKGCREYVVIMAKPW